MHPRLMQNSFASFFLLCRGKSSFTQWSRKKIKCVDKTVISTALFRRKIREKAPNARDQKSWKNLILNLKRKLNIIIEAASLPVSQSFFFFFFGGVNCFIKIGV
uniref:(northern house mosquito) hypothetical protein n=1 Tax=Culex pipiens TaxID=7175 RepID=A0A8D8CK75_CULPI